jgi:hypothetical protein
MDMHEDRDFSPSSSSMKTIFAVAGALLGLMVLVCGGAAGYVALTGTPPSEVERPTRGESMPPEVKGRFQKMEREMASQRIPPTEDPDIVMTVAAGIARIDLPEGFEPLEAQGMMSKRRAVFGKKSDNAALLKLAGSNWKLFEDAPRANSDDAIRFEVMKIAESNDNGRTHTVLKSTRKEMNSMQRELSVLGDKAMFEFRQGTRESDKKPVWRVWGTFRIPKGMAALIYLVPEAEFDEEAVVRMIESIRPPVLDESATDDESAPQQPTPE